MLSELYVKFIVLRYFLPSLSERMTPLAMVLVACSAEDELDVVDDLVLDNMMWTWKWYEKEE